jgi:hypothetical protein
MPAYKAAIFLIATNLPSIIALLWESAQRGPDHSIR